MESSLGKETETIDFFELPKSESLIQEINLVIENLKKHIFDFKTEEEIRIFIQNKQIHYLLSLEANKNNILDNEGLFFLECNFSKYLDINQKVSRLSRFKLYHQYKEEINQLILQLSNQISAKLLPIIYPIVQVYSHQERTLAKFLYQKKLIIELIKKKHSIELNQKSICEFLITHNYNHLTFIAFLINEIIHETNSIDHTEEQTDILISYQKSYQEIIVSKSLSFEPDYDSIKDQILKWLNLEIKSNNRKVDSGLKNQTRLEFNPQSKLQTAFTVAQLSCLLKVLIDEKLIVNEVEKEVYRFVSNNFETSKTKNISFQSLYNKSFEIENLTKESVKTILKGLIHKLNSL